MTVRRIGLVGCVKEKAPVRSTAADLYRSTLFAGRRRFVEGSCDAWWILSAAHGLVSPSAMLDPYDVALKDLGRAARRTWSSGVLAAIDQQIAPQRGDIVEIHAGAEYRDFGLVEGLAARGCRVQNPTEGMRIGEQLRFYGRPEGRS
ncbi:MAG: DUF6884 domain-containing protein [Planctomycetaceae bacterium]